MRRVFFLLSLLGLAARAVETPDAHELLRRGIALSREASFAASVAALEQARVKGPLSPSERADCGYWLATDYLALGSPQAARRELRQLVQAAPAFELPPYTSPKVAALYQDVRAAEERAPRLRALPPRSTMNGRDLALAFEPSRGGGLAFGAVHWRWQGEDDFVELPLGHSGENLIGHIAVERAGTLEFYAEARAPEGMAVAGSREHPLVLPVAEPSAPPPSLTTTTAADHKKRPLVRAWWLWTTVGAVASAGLGVGLYFALRPQPHGTADAVLDFGLR
jgi:tetratricopeptide (TPR) repeat protein